jgi:hypothetical protein
MIAKWPDHAQNEPRRCPAGPIDDGFEALDGSLGKALQAHARALAPNLRPAGTESTMLKK